MAVIRADIQEILLTRKELGFADVNRRTSPDMRREPLPGDTPPPKKQQR